MHSLQKNTLYEEAWETDHAWITGLIGATSIVLFAYIYYINDYLNTGVILNNFEITSTRHDSILLVLILSGVIMFIAELLQLWTRKYKNFFCITPGIKNGKYLEFLFDAFMHYVLNLCAIFLIIFFYQTTNEYGFQVKAEYYEIWFRFLDILKYTYLFLGFPYVLITRALKHDEKADKNDITKLIASVLAYITWYLQVSKIKPKFDQCDLKIMRGVLIKLFFTPLMTVFFAAHFPNLVSNIGFIIDSLTNSVINEEYTHSLFNRDLFNISISFIFSIDTALAWCGYVISSRWINNQNISTEFTLAGWMVCMICYPPFQFYNFYYNAPGERDIFLLSNDWIVTICVVAMALSYLIYMLATLWFGLRFSNLTNRGIIRKGPYAIIRHPAYASKNFAWWCVMFPMVIYNAFINSANIHIAIQQFLGLLLMSYIYYLRAITEEHHLNIDQHYKAYCEKVKYRFIPKLI